MKQIIQDLSFEQMSCEIAKLSLPSFRAKQLYLGLYEGKSIDEISNLPLSVKEKLKETFEKSALTVERQLEGKDGTIKFLYKLCDGNIIEGVLMRYKYGNTLCVSTQVGCRMGCKFCASTLEGLNRNLSAGEILSQVLIVNRLLGGDVKKREITNVVLMGSGEPLDNYDNVKKFLLLVNDENGINISHRNISLSTCGLTDKIKKLADDGFDVTLTISLHAPNDQIRKQIMPIAEAYSYQSIADAAKYYFDKTKRRIVFEYILIKNLNDDDKSAMELANGFKGISYHVNIIPLNEVRERTLKGTTKKEAYQFAKKLEDKGVSVTVRRTIGEDIEGACGQLRNKFIKQNKQG